MPYQSDRVAAVVVAAGRSQRLGQDKMLLPLGGVPLLAWTIDAFECSPLVDEIVLVANHHNLQALTQLCADWAWAKITHVELGGESRHDSVKHGLAVALGADWVMIHDGARPFVNSEIIERGLEAARATGAALAAVPVKDTIKIVAPDRRVISTPRRETLWAAQTPQVFRYDLLWDAHQRSSAPATDDASLLEQLGHTVLVYHGSYSNLKVTTAEDVELAKVIAARKTAPERRGGRESRHRV